MNAPDIRAVERALHAAGLSRRQAKAMIHSGWGGVVKETQREADLLKMELESLRVQLSAGTMAPSLPDA